MEEKIMRQIRSKAKQEGEAIRTGRDAYGNKGYMIIEANRNIILSGEGFTLTIEDLCKNYGIDCDE